MRERSSILFDIIIIYGARAANGVSKEYQNLYGLLRQHTSDLVLRLSQAAIGNVSIEDIQAMLASYSESAAVLCDVAICAAMRAGLPQQLESLLSSIAERKVNEAQQEQSLFTAARVWSYIFVLDMILSLDGGKPPSIILRSSPRRIKSCLHHPRRTTLDIRLFAQVELNAIRSHSHASLVNAAAEPYAEEATSIAIRGAILDLDLWLSEWQGVVLGDSTISSEHDVVSLNLRIQHAWAVLALYLRALTASGIDNIALMTESQRHIAFDAKTAAEQHLQLLLTATKDRPGASGTTFLGRPYIANFKYAMEFVWAKNAFCVLIVLRLGILLSDSPDHLMARLSEANEIRQELDKVGIGANISYTRILTKTVQKCEKAVTATLRPEGLQNLAESSDSDFQSFIPKEFMFEWDFPGLHLCYIPLEWQDLFLDLGTTT